VGQRERRTDARAAVVGVGALEEKPIDPPKELGLAIAHRFRSAQRWVGRAAGVHLARERVLERAPRRVPRVDVDRRRRVVELASQVEEPGTPWRAIRWATRHAPSPTL
jgi:hypothetical protein